MHALYLETDYLASAIDETPRFGAISNGFTRLDRDADGDTTAFAFDAMVTYSLTDNGAVYARLSYGETEALHGINMDIHDRGVTALIGPSGCGKSSFLRVFNRMNDTIPGARVTGTILMDGEDIYADGGPLCPGCCGGLVAFGEPFQRLGNAR